MSVLPPIYRTEHGEEFPAIVTPDGKVRFLARTPPEQRLRAPRFSDHIAVISRQDWPKYQFSRPRPTVPILDQGQYGSCNPHACTTALMRSRDAAGYEFQLLSACFLYAQINGGRDMGSNIGDGATALAQTGTCLETQGPEGRVFKRQYAAAAWQDAVTTAARFRLDPGQTFDVRTFDEAVTAAILGFHFVISVFVAGDWNNLDADGCPPAYAGPGNHAVCGGDGFSISSRGEPLLDITNSWGLGWGNKGRFRIREAHITHQQYFECVAFKSASPDPQDPTNPQPVTG